MGRITVGALSLISVLWSDVFGIWAGIAGPSGGAVSSVAANDSVILAGTQNGLYLSTDQGVNWDLCTSFKPQNIQKLATAGTIILAATSDSGCELSKDNGVSWSALPGGTQFTMNSFLAADSILYVGGTGTVSYSRDTGATWKIVGSGLSPGTVCALWSMGSDYLLAGLSNGKVLRSTNTGDTWESPAAGLPGTSVNGFAQIDTLLFAVTPTRLYRSSDSGMTWAQAGPSSFDTIRSILVLGPRLCLGTRSGVSVSDDSIANWSTTNAGLTEKNVTGLTVQGGKLFAATDSGIFVSADSGATWAAADKGITTSTFISAAIDGKNILAGTAAGGMYRSLDSGATWSKVYSVATTPVTALAALGNYCIGGTSSGGILQSADTGATWKTVAVTPASVTSLVFDKGILYAGSASGNGVFWSADSGASWKPAKSFSSSIISQMTAFGATLVAAAFPGIYLSSDTGKSWTASRSGVPDDIIYGLSCAGACLYAATRTALYVSADTGLSWTAVKTNLTAPDIGCLGSVGGALLLGTRDGKIFLSANGVSWREFSESLPGTAILSIIPSGQSACVSASGHGLMRRAMSEMLSTPPNVTASPLDQTVVLGQTASFTVASFGFALTYQWLKNGVSLTTGGDSATVRINGTTAEDSGAVYRCIVSNAWGADTSAPAVLRVVPPGTPVVSSLSAITATRFEVVSHGDFRCRYSLAKPSGVSLRIFSASGRLEWTWTCGLKQPGIYCVSPEGLTNGVHVVEFAADGFSSVERAVVTK